MIARKCYKAGLWWAVGHTLVRVSRNLISYDECQVLFITWQKSQWVNDLCQCERQYYQETVRQVFRIYFSLGNFRLYCRCTYIEICNVVLSWKQARSCDKSQFDCYLSHFISSVLYDFQFIWADPGWTGEQFEPADRAAERGTSYQWHCSQPNWYSFVQCWRQCGSGLGPEKVGFVCLCIGLVPVEVSSRYNLELRI